jgi:thioredoxin
MKIRILTILFIFIALSSCSGQTSKKYESILPAVFAEKINTIQDPLILDVRTPEEFSGQHLDNAVNINWNSNDFVSKLNTYDRKKPVFVYCMTGGRSRQAAQKLNELGFANVYELQGGIMKWNAAGLATRAYGEQGEAKPADRIIGMCSQEFKELLDTDKKVLVSFYADWCAPCKKMAPYITKLQKDLSEKVTIVRLNADEHKTLVSEMKIDELPTLILYEKKQVKWQHSGFMSEEDLKKQL